MMITNQVSQIQSRFPVLRLYNMGKELSEVTVALYDAANVVLVHHLPRAQQLYYHADQLGTTAVGVYRRIMRLVHGIRRRLVNIQCQQVVVHMCSRGPRHCEARHGASAIP